MINQKLRADILLDENTTGALVVSEGRAPQGLYLRLLARDPGASSESTQQP